MDESKQAVPEERLAELRRVTRHYGVYSRVTGLPVAALGAWFLAGMLAMPTTAGRLVLVAAPLAWAGAAGVSSSLYTRRGVVTSMPRGWLWLGTVLVWVMGGLWLFELTSARWLRAVVPRGALLGGALLVLLVVGLLAYRWTKDGRSTDAWVTFIFSMIGVRDPRPFDERWGGWAYTAVAALFVLAGIYSHLRFRRLERRMAALREEP